MIVTVRPFWLALALVNTILAVAGPTFDYGSLLATLGAGLSIYSALEVKR